MITGTHNPITGRYLPTCLQNRDISDGDVILTDSEMVKMDEPEVDAVQRELAAMDFDTETDDEGHMVAVGQNSEEEE